MAQANVVKIWVIAPLSGPAATYWEDFLHGYTHVVDAVNEAWGINGQKIELVVEDGKCSGKDAAAAVQKLINVDNVEIILGWWCSSETIAAGKIAQQAWVVMVSAGSSSPEVSEIGDYIFRYWNDADVANVLAEYFANQEVATIWLVYENSDYAVAYANTVRELFEGDIVVDERFATEEKDFAILAKNVATVAEDLDALVFVPQSEANTISFVKALVDEEVWWVLNGKLYGTDTVLSSSTIEWLWEDADGIKWFRFPEADGLDANAKEMISRLMSEYTAKTSDVFVLLAADSAELVLEAIEQRGDSAEEVKAYIEWITSDNMRQANFGSFYFDEQGDGQWIPFVLVEIVNGELVTVE